MPRKKQAKEKANQEDEASKIIGELEDYYSIGRLDINVIKPAATFLAHRLLP